MKILYNKEQIAQILNRMTEQIAEGMKAKSRFVVIGIRSRGEILAKRLSHMLSRQLRREIPCGTLDITLYRDDLHEPRGNGQPTVRSTEIDFDVNDTTILLVDDVLHTGRSVRAAMDALTDLGRPKEVRLAVLIDRGSHELPIRADYVGQKAQVPGQQSVYVQLHETDQVEQVIVE